MRRLAMIDMQLVPIPSLSALLTIPYCFLPYRAATAEAAAACFQAQYGAWFHPATAYWHEGTATLFVCMEWRREANKENENER